MKSVLSLSSNHLVIVSWSQSIAVTSIFSDFKILQSSFLLFNTAINGGAGNTVHVPYSTTNEVATEEIQNWSLVSELSLTLYMNINNKVIKSLKIKMSIIYSS